MIDVLFTASYVLKFDLKEYRTMMPYPPLGTLYAAAFIRSKGYSVALFDSMLAEFEDEIIPAIEQQQPKVVVIYDDDFNYLTKMCLSRMRQVAFRLTRLAKERNCIVVVHGSDAADHIDAYVQHGADYVIVGEGEFTLLELLDTITGKKITDFGGINGLAHRSNGAVHQNAKREVVHDLDQFPFPAWDIVNLERYRKLWKKQHGYFSMNMVTTRGCPFHCNWCAKPIYGQVYNSRSPENVVEEMSFLKANYNPDHIWFCDDIFGLKPGWVSRFDEAVQRANAVIPFKCLARVDLLLKENTIEHLSHAGCESVWVGAESGSQKILDAMEKGTTVEQIYQATKLLHRHKIRVGFFLQYGYPGETREDIERTLQMVKDCKPDDIGISVSYPLPGTRFYENVRDQLGDKKNWVDSQDLDLMFAGEFVPDFYRTLHKVTHKKFRLWQGVDLLKRAITHPLSVDRKTLRRIAASAYHAVTLPPIKAEMELLARQPNPSKPLHVNR